MRAPRWARSRLIKFLVVGGTSVAIDGATYALLFTLTGHSLSSKVVSFLAGAIFAYFANWRFTFGRRRSRWSELLFLAVYVSSLLINAGLNELVLALTRGWAWSEVLAFLIATGTSAAWNFAGMSLFVFVGPEPKEVGTK